MGLMRVNRALILLTFFTISLGKSTPGLITFSSADINHQTKEINITLSPWKANKPTVAHYDSSFKEAKQIFNEDFSITLIATSYQTNSVHLYCSYYRYAEKKINHAQFPLFFAAPQADMNEMIDTDTMVIEEYEQPKKIHKTTFIEHYNSITLSLIHTIITSLHTDHKKYFALLLFLFSVLISFFYFFKKELQKQIRIKEALEIII